MVQQHGNDLLGPEVLNGSTELGHERKLRTVSIDSVLHNILAVCLYKDIVCDKRQRRCRTRSVLYLSDEWVQDFDFGEP